MPRPAKSTPPARASSPPPTAATARGCGLIVDNGLFFEFVPVEELGSADPTRHWLANAETGVNYALVLSTCAGLWSYLIGDTVRFVERNPPRILITGRTSYSLSAFGEHLIGEEIEKGVAAAAAAIGAGVTDFSVGAVYPATEREPGGHLYIVEFVDEAPGADRLAEFARVLDETLCRLNVDYRDHRAKDFQMRSPVVHAVPPGTFAAWMKRRGKLGGQNKVPRVINDQALFDDLKASPAAVENPHPLACARTLSRRERVGVRVEHRALKSRPPSGTTRSPGEAERNPGVGVCAPDHLHTLWTMP